MARVGLTRDAVLDAAVALADSDGLDKLSMRRLAGELGVEAMSLYNHVDGKRDLLEGIVDRVWAEVDLAADEPDWRQGVRRLCRTSRAAMLAHPWFFQLPVIYGGVARLRVLDATLGHMRRAGVDAAVAYHAQHVIDGFVFGYAWQEVGFTGEEMEERGARMMATVVESQLSWLLEHAEMHGDPPSGDGFDVGLEMILDGIAPDADAGAGGP